MKIQDDAIVCYESTLEVIERLPEDIRGNVLWSLMEYGFNENDEDVELPPEVKIALTHVLNGITTQKRRYRNKKIVNLYISTIENQIACELGYPKDLGETVVKNLKKLIVQVQRNDITDIEVRIKGIIPNELLDKLPWAKEKQKNTMVFDRRIYGSIDATVRKQFEQEYTRKETEFKYGGSIRR